MLVSTATAQSPLAQSNDLDAYVRSQMTARHIPGLSLAVVRRGKIVKATGYGVADIEHAVTATSSTVYELASMTKQFTAMAVMMLVREGKISLDDPIARYVPQVPGAWHGVTIRRLLNHTSGIPNHTDLPVILNDESKDYTPSEMLAIIPGLPVKFNPGEKWEYNDSGYFLLGLAVEKASGVPYEQFVRERIFRPLGMASTRGNVRGSVITMRAAALYTGRRPTAPREMGQPDAIIRRRTPGLDSPRLGEVGYESRQRETSATTTARADVDTGAIERWPTCSVVLRRFPGVVLWVWLGGW